MPKEKEQTNYQIAKCEACPADAVLIHPSKWNSFKFPTWVCAAKNCGHQQRIVDEKKLLNPEIKTYPFWKAYIQLCRQYGCIVEAKNQSSLEIITDTSDTSYLDQHFAGLDPLQ